MLENIDDKLSVMTVIGQPINFVATKKCGQTFVQNLLYFIEHNKEICDPQRINMNGTISVQSIARDQVNDEVSFYIVRNPTDRFFSLYFDNLIGDSTRQFPWLRKKLHKNRGFHLGTDLTIMQHQKNCRALIAFLEQKMKNLPSKRAKLHWRPQVDFLADAICFGMTPILLEDLENQLLQIANGRIKFLEEAFIALPRFHQSNRFIQQEDLLTEELERRLLVLYAHDYQLYENAKHFWSDTDSSLDLIPHKFLGNMSW